MSRGSLKLTTLLPLMTFLVGCNIGSSNLGEYPEYIERSNSFVKTGPGGHQIYWTRDEQIIFVREVVNNDGLVPEREYYLYSWNNTGIVEQLRREQIVFTCFDGHQQLTQTTDGLFFAGTYDAPIAFNGTRFIQNANNKLLEFDQKTCTYIRSREKKGQTTILHLADFGVVTLGRHQKSPEYIDSNNNKHGPLDSFPIGSQKIKYLNFLDRYLVMDFVDVKRGNHKWEANGCLEGYLLSKEGGLDKFCVPQGPWSGSNVDIELTNNGLLVISYGAEPGIYWLKDEMYHKVIEGSVRDIEIAYDGCKVAVVHQFDTSRKGNKMAGELIRFNVCNFNMEQ